MRLASLRRARGKSRVSIVSHLSFHIRSGVVRHIHLIGVLAAFVVLVLVLGGSRAEASDTATRWDSFSESSTCGAPFTRGPFASRKGFLAESEPVLGPFGTYFGRSISEVRSQLVFWTVPHSGGRRVQVHKAMLPSLQEVSKKLAQHASEGRIYQITSASSFVPRTIGGRYQISRHAMGLAIDLNPAQNPYRADGVLVTNMPSWFVDAWKSSGFCWGGDWPTSKDAMHFSWMGPAATPEADTVAPRPPKTTKTGFRSAGTHKTVFHNVMGRYQFGVADGSGNGTSDVLGLRPHPGGSVLDIASSTLGLGECSIFRWFIPDETISGVAMHFYADLDGDTGQDLVVLSPNGGTMNARVATRAGRFRDLSTRATGAASDAVAFTGADFDGDDLADLWEITADDRLRVWRGPQMTQKLHESALPIDSPMFIAAGDRDGGNRPELFVFHAPGGASALTALTLSGNIWTVEHSLPISTSPEAVLAMAANDYDGDGRSDAQIFDTSGRLAAYVGNSSTGITPSRWFLNPDFACDSNDIRLVYKGSFYDDDGSIFEGNIESIAAAGVTRGCNPPFNDRFCPRSLVTRETMAAFLVRALGLTANTHSGFVDVPASGTFANDIGKLATAGITKGCNPPRNDMFCPDQPVTRETMAAFLVRALKLSEDAHPGFADVAANNIFIADIERLATAGITKGCNPPANDRFCPKDLVTRETMAAFLDRAGLGS